MKKVIKAKKPLKRIKMHRELRLSIVTLLVIIIIASSYSAYSASQEPTTIEKIVPTYIYTHKGIWDYQVYIKDNSLYDTNVLGPGDGKNFKKLIEHINMSFSYEFLANQKSTIHGSYKITAEIQTSLWSKEFIITPTTHFNSSINQAKFTDKFPLNITIYEDFIFNVNSETGSSAGDSKLVIKCTVSLSAKTAEEKIDDTFSRSLQIALRSEIVNIDGTLVSTQPGSIEKTEKVYQPGVTTQTNNWTSSSIIITLICAGFVIVTKSDLEAQKLMTRQIKKIQKKFGEWIVEVEKLPKRGVGVELVSTKSMDDLVKISEELGKPIIYYTSDKKETHTFYVIDEAIHYKYTLSEN